MTFPIPESALSQHIAVLGMTGSGKTSTEKLIIEHVVAKGARVCVLDTIKSDWWGITSSASGKSPGLPFRILGGPRGHVPLHSSAGKAIGQLVGNGKLPLSIIDMADFEAGGVQRFFVDFAQALWRSIRGVVYLVIEEAHELAPKERAGFNQENMAIHWAKKLATGSRTKGIRLVVATQRVQSLHNAVLSSCGTLIAHRFTYDADQEPIIRWLKGVKKDMAGEIAASLSSLEDGEGWLCSGREQVFERIRFPKFKTYDNTATPTGDEADIDIKTAPVDQEELRAIIGDAVADAIANDPAELKKRIRELERKLAAPGTSTADLETARRKGFKEGYQAASAEIGGKVFDLINAGNEFMAKLRSVGSALDGTARPAAASKAGLTVDKPALSPVKTPISTGVKRLPASPAERINGEGESLPRGEAAILAACIQFPSGLRREQLTVLVGYKRSSRDTYIQRLRERGYVQVAGDRIMATEEGLAALPNAEPLPTGPALREYWLARLPEGERKILSVLIESYPDGVPRDELSERTGYRRSSRDTYIQRLSAKQLVSEPARGEVRASETLFGCSPCVRTSITEGHSNE